PPRGRPGGVRAASPGGRARRRAARRARRAPGRARAARRPARAAARGAGQLQLQPRRARHALARARVPDAAAERHLQPRGAGPRVPPDGDPRRSHRRRRVVDLPRGDRRPRGRRVAARGRAPGAGGRQAGRRAAAGGAPRRGRAGRARARARPGALRSRPGPPRRDQDARRRRPRHAPRAAERRPRRHQGPARAALGQPERPRHHPRPLRALRAAARHRTGGTRTMRRPILAIVLAIVANANALDLAEAWRSVPARPDAITTRLELITAESALLRVESDPLALRLDRLRATQEVELLRAQHRHALLTALQQIAEAYTSVLQAREQVALAQAGLEL